MSLFVTDDVEFLPAMSHVKYFSNKRQPNRTLLLLCPGGKPDDITVLLSIVAEYTD